jgi:putative SOS response-associated peptidase YedK
MCGRYTITQDLAELEKLVRFIYGAGARPERPRYNIAPRQQAPVLIWESGAATAATLKPMRWGLVPSWAKDETIGDKLTNACAETVTEKSSYRRPFEKQRCLIPADGFYEWQTTLTGKQPFRFTRKDGGFFCMAGLWEKWIRPQREGELGLDDTGPSISQIVETFTVITTTPNAMVTKVHDRMPVILGPEHFQWWLEPERFEREFLKTLLRPYPAEEMDCCRVSRLVNSAKNDGPECLTPS